MGIIVEDGTGLADANSYVSETDADAYFEDRDNTDWNNYSGTNDKEGALIRGTDYIDAAYGQLFSGWKVKGRDQALAWPRIGATDSDGWLIDANSIPPEVIEATCEAAVRELVEPGSMQPDLAQGGATKRLKAGSVEIEYGANATGVTSHAVIGNMLNRLLGMGQSGSSYFAKAIRG